MSMQSWADRRPKTIDDLTAACAKLKAGATCYADGGTYGWAVMPWSGRSATSRSPLTSQLAM